MKPKRSSYTKLARRLREAVGRCVVCQNPYRLQVAHLVSRHEIELHGWPKLFKDRRNLTVLCQPCHSALDWWLNINAWRATPEAAKVFHRRYVRYQGSFEALGRLRNVLLCQALAS